MTIKTEFKHGGCRLCHPGLYGRTAVVMADSTPVEDEAIDDVALLPAL